MDINPVFIMGCQRSGTTMLASQLGMGEDVIAFPEMQFVLKLINKSYRNSVCAEQAYQNLMSDFRFKVSGLKIKKEDFLIYYAYRDLSEVVSLLIKSNIKDSAIEKITWIEHNPKNRDAVLELANAFPNAKFVHIYRDPRAVYWSMKSNPRWHIGDPITFSRLWVEAVSKCFLHFSNSKLKIVQVSYENYVTQTEDELKKLCQFLEIEFSAQMLKGGGVKLPKFTQPQHALTTKPTDVSRINKWKNRVSDYDELLINSMCYDWMHQYGYLSERYLQRTLSCKDKMNCGLRSLKSILVAKMLNKYQNKNM